MFYLRSLFVLHVIGLVEMQEWTKLNCPAPRSPQNGVSFIFEDGLKVQYRCHPGFIMRGRHFSVCRHNKWDSPPPYCVHAKTTSMPTTQNLNSEVAYDQSCLEKTRTKSGFVWAPKISNGYVKLYSRIKNNTYPYNHYLVAHYDCLEGFTMESNSSIKLYCRKQNWIGEYPKCIRAVNISLSCYTNNGGCHHICHYIQGKISCSCRNGYSLAADKRACKRDHFTNKNINIQGDDSREEKNPCQENNGGCDHDCRINEQGEIVCSCFRGFQLAEDSRKCHDIDECLSNNGGCEGKCYNHIGYFICRCPVGYKLAADRRSCQDINECFRNNGHGPCSDQCINTKGGYLCSCTIPGTVLGPNNHTCDDIDECAKGNFGCSHTCWNTYGNAFCSCPTGFKLDNDDKTCIDFNECGISEFAQQCKGNCINTVGSFLCHSPQEEKEISTHLPLPLICHPGYKLTEYDNCEDIDECLIDNGNCSHNCINTQGSFYCYCPDGYKIDDEKNCTDIDECLIDNGNCSHNCINTQGSFYCYCPDGYKLDNEKNCIDIDECLINNGNCSHICTNTQGSFHCYCPDGYKLDNEKNCIDIDECSVNKGGCHQGCINTEGSFHCTCSEGYTKSKSNSFTCTDINECLNDDNNCDHKCINYEGGYYCACDNGYRLAADLKSCVEIICSKLPKPHNGKLQCDSSATGGKPVNTTCQLICKRGFKENIKEIKCGLNGEWIGQLPSCEPLFCPAIEKPEYGNVNPPSCLNGSSVVFQKCFFTCDTGYKLIGHAFMRCDRNLEWKPKVLPKCVKNELEPFIKCPADISVNLKPQQAKHHIKIPKPKSNMEVKHIKIHPTWAEQLEGDFPAGITEIYFTAHHPSKNLTATCKMIINVLDKEAPIVRRCPRDIEIYSESLDPIEVFWEEPIFTDNVKIESISKSQTPGSKFGIGEHLIHYIAKDPSGGIATCIFTVKILRKECGEPNDFLHGEKNCMDLLNARLCTPTCNPGYTFYSNISEFYICGLDGNWLPSKNIPDCSPFVTESENGCLPGTEFREEIDTYSRICVACPPGMYWEIKISSCLPCPKNSFQDEFGQTTCKSCSEETENLEICKNVASLKK